MTQTTFNVSGMSCMGCVNSIRKVLEPMSGVHKVEISLEQGCVQVEHDVGLASVDSIRQAIEDAGYDVL